MKRNSQPFKWRQYEPEIICFVFDSIVDTPSATRPCEMMHERGLSVHHSTVYRWVQRYAPKSIKESARF